MTGTPLQNELNELFCLLAFLEEVQTARAVPCVVVTGLLHCSCVCDHKSFLASCLLSQKGTLLQVRAADIERLIEATPDPASFALGSTAATALPGERSMCLL